jgi:hypothetical protein
MNMALARVARVLPSTTTARDELLLHTPGFCVKADDAVHAAFLDHAVPILGFHVVALDYPNCPTMARACRCQPLSCFETTREQRLS